MWCQTINDNVASCCDIFTGSECTEDTKETKTTTKRMFFFSFISIVPEMLCIWCLPTWKASDERQCIRNKFVLGIRSTHLYCFHRQSLRIVTDGHRCPQKLPTFVCVCEPIVAKPLPFMAGCLFGTLKCNFLRIQSDMIAIMYDPHDRKSGLSSLSILKQKLENWFEYFHWLNCSINFRLENMQQDRNIRRKRNLDHSWKKSWCKYFLCLNWSVHFYADLLVLVQMHRKVI